MESLSELRTVAEADEFIDNQICRHMPGLRARAESREWSTEERAADMKLDAVLNALERRAELAAADLQSQIPSYLYVGKGMRVCDIRVYLKDSSESEIERALESNVRSGKAERYEHGGQVFYLLKEVRVPA